LAWCMGQREAEVGKRGSGEAGKVGDKKTEGSKGAFGRWRLEVGGRKAITTFFPQSANQRINQSTGTDSIINTISILDQTIQRSKPSQPTQRS